MGKRRKLQHAPRSMARPSPQHKAVQLRKDKLSGRGGGRGGSTLAVPGKMKPQPKPETKKPQQQHEKPTIPFNPEDRILLLGEGDLSFAASIITHHHCKHVTATVLEPSRDALLEKYPHAETHMAAIQRATTEDDEARRDPKGGCRIVYHVDATARLPASLARPLYNRILFNFPHVGGRSTDVNRQVRYNQELLVQFFERSLPALAPGGAIIVTLFEGEPYTLWNVKDLGRHVGLQVERSFRFQAAAYPGYAHARTLGVVRSKKGGEERAGWRGEDRQARSYVFRRKGEVPEQVSKKRRRDDSDSSDSD